MDKPALDVPTKVQAVLEMAGLIDKVSKEEFDVFVRIYPSIRAAADSLYGPEVEYEEIALLFSPEV